MKKQGESYYDRAKQEFAAASSEASKGSADLVNYTSATTPERDGEEKDAGAETEPEKSTETIQRPESLPADIVKEAESMLSRLRTQATARLKQIEKAEDAADEALEKFGVNIKNFLRDAVTIRPPSEDETKGELLFESKDADGRRVVHANRFDAQLHVIHSTLSSFTKDPDSPQYTSWSHEFDAEKETDAIATDLDKYPELRRAMEKAVPEQVDYPTFWTRYYFLRHVIETEEQRRRELLKDTLAQEEVAWDDDDDEDSPTRSRAASKGAAAGGVTPTKSTSKDSDYLKPNEPRRSNEHSVADSDASYDLVSGAPSRGPGSPKDRPKTLQEESDEEDWE